MPLPLYRGYSSFEYQKNKTFSLNDIELVKMDILNHIFTRRGERVMMPNFGTGIPDLAFEPLDQFTIDILREELLTVAGYDPRVELINLDLTPEYDANSIIASLNLFFIELNTASNLDFRIEFENFNA